MLNVYFVILCKRYMYYSHVSCMCGVTTFGYRNYDYHLDVCIFKKVRVERESYNIMNMII